QVASRLGGRRSVPMPGVLHALRLHLGGGATPRDVGAGIAVGPEAAGGSPALLQRIEPAIARVHVLRAPRPLGRSRRPHEAESEAYPHQCRAAETNPHASLPASAS